MGEVWFISHALVHVFDNLRGEFKYLYKVIESVLSLIMTVELVTQAWELNKTTNVNVLGNDVDRFFKNAVILSPLNFCDSTLLLCLKCYRRLMHWYALHSKWFTKIYVITH